ncbi:two-component system histidine kinase PnpS [Companilactobacillus ginsenosidimutans]|uniref:histidine kinase n=1 Tax=Companilactobacillus ginsenosidimutans TaxID=1007676 RepID=A0A0H4R359_9LACO|nr:ATP-binding protein [Companilactobacillus ginsenosidimutans]AKP68210.1 histidine kinase [Companilactobacillus ginsenosidimutans]
MKRRLGPTVSIVISVILYIALALFADNILSNSQSNSFSEEVESYTELRKNHTKEEAADVTSLKYININDDSDISKQASDMIHRGNLSMSEQFGTDVSFGRRAMFYRFNNGNYVVAKDYSRLWNQNWISFALFTILYFLITEAIILVYYRQRQNIRDDIDRVTQNLKRVRKNKDMSSLILSPDDDLYELVEQTNQINKDISELRDNAKLRERRFKSLIGHLPIGVMLLNSQGEVLLHNQAMAALLDENISNELHPFIEDVKTYGLSRMIEHALRKNKNYRREIQLVGNSQRYVDANVIHLVHSREDYDKQILVILYDLTTSRRMEQMQVDFVNNVSHELKTPITSIEGFSETLLDGAGDDPEKRHHFLEIIHNESVRLTDLIQDILSLSKIKKDNEETELVDMEANIKSILQSMSVPIEKHHLKVDKSFFGNKEVTINKAKVNLVLNNLIKNAISYNKENGSIDIEVHHDEVENRLRVIIEDTGIGISQKDQDRIFERFYRVDRSRSLETGGTGLGLAIVKETLDSIDGNLQVESNLGLGTKFTLEIPL